MTRSRIIGAIIALVAVILFLNFGTGWISGLLSAKKEARVVRGQAKATVESVEDANNKMGEVDATGAEIDGTVKGATDAIKSQPPGRSNDAAQRAACGMRSYRNSERCAAMRQADSARAAGENASR